MAVQRRGHEMRAQQGSICKCMFHAGLPSEEYSHSQNTTPAALMHRFRIAC